MHPNLNFRNASDQQNIEFARQRGFGTLAINAPDNADGDNVSAAGPMLSHIPFILDSSTNALFAHLVRSNPILKLLDEERPAVVAVSGPDAYISPDWYEIDDQVPTWNYVAVHIRGRIKRLPDGKLAEILNQLSSQFEQRLAPKPEWTSDKMDRQTLARVMKMIVPVSMQITAIEGTWKLSQNKPDEVRISAARQMSENPIGSQVSDLADIMKNPPC